MKGPFNPPKPPKCETCGLFTSFAGMHTRTCQCPKKEKFFEPPKKMNTGDLLQRSYFAKNELLNKIAVKNYGRHFNEIFAMKSRALILERALEITLREKLSIEDKDPIQAAHDIFYPSAEKESYCHHPEKTCSYFKGGVVPGPCDHCKPTTDNSQQP